MNKRQKTVLVGRRPQRRSSSRDRVEEKYGPSILLRWYRRMRMDSVLMDLHEAYKRVMGEYNEAADRPDTEH